MNADLWRFTPSFVALQDSLKCKYSSRQRTTVCVLAVSVWACLASGHALGTSRKCLTSRFAVKTHKPLLLIAPPSGQVDSVRRDTD